MSTETLVVPDWRHLASGWSIPSLAYCDQVYVVHTDDGAWLSVMTTGRGKEGERGQHLIAQRSLDQGRTWGAAVEIESPEGVEASYAVLLKVPGGRVYAFYNHNTDNITEVRDEFGCVHSRVDSLGHYVFKYSDDHGLSWSRERYEVPVRSFKADRENLYGGALRMFWNVGRPFIGQQGRVYLPHIKVGSLGEGFFCQSEGAILCSDNILSERDPAKVRFVTLPEGEIGLRTPVGGGRVSEEQSVVELSDGTLYCVYRSIDGYPVSSYSADGGKTWTAPQYKTYTPGGRRIKHPRAANFVWKCSNGRYLYWFHNHGGGESARGAWNSYSDRNPAWISAGHEVDTPEGKRLAWSQPEVLLYDDSLMTRMSYPDLVETEGRFYVTETQKSIARTHPIDPDFLETLFAQKDSCHAVCDGVVLEGQAPFAAPLVMPRLPVFLERDYSRDDQAAKDLRSGISIELRLTLATLDAGQILLDTRTANGHGWALRVVEEGALEVVLNDGHTENRWRSDRGSLVVGREQHVAVILDGGPKLILFVVDGALQDGGEERQFGWGHFSPELQDIAGQSELKVGPAVRLVRLYTRALLVSEAVGLSRSV